jgi:hypothetical protein
MNAIQWIKSSYSANNGDCVEVAAVPIKWIKSSFSANNGDCVEVAAVPTEWAKSSYSANNGSCVEVAAFPGRIATRDSKNADGPVLSFDPAAWAAFITTVAQTG